jgi:acetyl/propionyl-CoA carboxylase alpha subunit
LTGAIRSALNEAGGSGAELSIYLERYLEGARHVEVQTVGDGERAIAIGDRDCSLQRRHQKVIEEAPAPGIDAGVRGRLWDAAARLATAVGLRSLATVEFLMDRGGDFYFMEINPRLQVEHTVTEEVTGLDLVAVQLDLAVGGALPEPVEPAGHAIQARLYAEDPFNQFLPDPGLITLLKFPVAGEADTVRLRIDQGYESGDRIPASFDSMIAKVIVHSADRAQAIEGLAVALRRTRLAGIHTNRPWLVDLLESEAFRANRHDLTTAGDIVSQPRPPEPDEVQVAAGAAIDSQAGASAWETSGPFRMVSPARLVFHGDEAGGWQLAVEVASQPGGWGADDADCQSPGIAAVEIDDGYEITSAAGRWLARVGPRAATASRSRQADGVIVAPMPGKLLSVEIAEGERVTEGQIVAVLEAMKIEISLSAPFDGHVAGVQAKAGDLVGTRQPLVTILPDESETNP